jgi:YD repeat-containing protein
MKIKNKSIILIMLLIFSLVTSQETVPGSGNIRVKKSEDYFPRYEKDVEINLYTGTPTISIPIEKIEQKEKPLDLSIDYDATGVLVDIPSGIVGQNWSFDGGGYITRKVKGMCHDEVINTQDNPQPGLGFLYHQAGFFYTKDLLNRDDWNTKDYLSKFLCRASNVSLSPDLDACRKGTSGIINDSWTWKIDSEPDIFYFNFFGKSGYFYMNENGNWNVSSKSNLKVIYDPNTDLINPVVGYHSTTSASGNLADGYKRKSIGRLTIVDDQGYKYIFGDNNLKSMEVYLGEYYHSTLLIPYVTKWNIVKVINPDGIVLYDFDYTSGEYFLNNLHADANFEVSSSNDSDPRWDVGYSNAQELNNNYQMYKLYRASGYLYKPSYLKQIRNNQGVKVDFLYKESDNIIYTKSGNNLFMDNIYYNNYFISSFVYTIFNDEIPLSNKGKHNRYLLDKIEISFNNIAINKINFNYSNAGPRSFLIKATKNDVQNYQFEYTYPNELPGYLSEKKDMWGYYNGYETKVSFSPFYLFWKNFEDNKFFNRASNSSKIKSGTLEKIIWPTGGSTEFTFEPHTFRRKVSIVPSANGVASLLEMFSHGGGGLRIKKIKNIDSEREFFYCNDFDDIDQNISSGILMYEPFFYAQHQVYPTESPNSQGYSSGSTSSANAINSKSDFLSSNVTYTNVIEKKNDGYIFHSFYDYHDYPDYFLPGLRPGNKLSKKVDLSFERGMIKSRTFFNSNQTKLSETIYNYKTLSTLIGKGIEYDFITTNWQYYHESDPISTGGFFGIPQPMCLTCNSKVNPYLIHYSDKVLDYEFHTDFFSNNKTVKKLKKYYYKSPLDPSYFLLGKEEDYVELNNPVKFKSTTYDYTVDMDTSDPLIEDMINKNMVGVIFITKKFNENNIPILKIENVYGKNSKTNFLILPIAIEETKINDIDISNEKIEKVKFDLYDNKGRILQYTTISGVPNSIIYGYNKTLPIAILEGITYSSLANLINIESIQDASDVDVDLASQEILLNYLDELRTNANLNNYKITTYTYDPLIGVTSITPPSGIREIYKYDSANRLQSVVDINGKILKEYQYNYKQ